MSPHKPSKNAVPAIERALDIFEYLGQMNKSMTLKEISSTLDIPLASAFRIVKYLCSRGYLKEEQETRRYYLGLQFLNIARFVSKQMDLRVVAAKTLHKLAETTSQTAQLAILEEKGVMYIDQVLPIKPVNMIASLGNIIPVNICALGKVLVAYKKENEREAYLQKAEFRLQTPKSITDKIEFSNELDKVLRQGYAFDDEEYARGVGCLAAPIFNYLGENIAAIGITGQIEDYRNKARFEKILQQLLEANKEISYNLGYGGYSGSTER